MIDGLRVTVSGDELRALLQARIRHHEQRAAWWAHEQARAPEDAAEDAPLLPDHMCGNEADRHAWCAEVLRFVHDHIEACETYRLTGADLDFGELLPGRAGWLAWPAPPAVEEADEFESAGLDSGDGPKGS